MVLPVRTHYLEISPLKVNDEHIRFTCSLHTAVLDMYGAVANAAMKEQSMELDEVLGYLRGIEDYTLGPMDAIRAQTDAIGDPSLPTPAQVATLEWLQDAYALWEEDYPIEEPLRTQLRTLRPAAAAQRSHDEA